MVSAWACRQRLVLGQEAVRDTSNEITAIPLLLERLALTGALVTIDAIGTQTKIAETIVTRGGDYLLALKPNRPLLFAEVEAFFKGPEAGSLDTRDTTPAPQAREGAIPTTAAWRSAATPSAITSTGCSPTAATPASRSSHTSP